MNLGGPQVLSKYPVSWLEYFARGGEGDYWDEAVI